MLSQSSPVEQNRSRAESVSWHIGLAPALVPAMLVLILVLSVCLFTLTTGGLRVLAVLAAAAGIVLFMLWRLTSTHMSNTGLMRVLRNVNDAQGDLSSVMPVVGDETSRETARLFNQFMERLRTALDDLRHHTIKVSLSSAQGRKIAEEASRDAGKQEDYSEIIYRSSEETATAIEELSRWTNNIADVNSRNLSTARDAVADLVRANSQIATVGGMMQQFHGTVEQLETTSENIRAILGTVQGFAAQTNMLALNAAIEAARAGEQGRGFAVVADEVRDLAVKVRGSADEIGALLEEMIGVVSKTSSGTERMISETGQAGEAIDKSAGEFKQMVNGFESTHSDLLQVSAAAEQLSVNNQDIRSRSHEIRDLGGRIRSDMEKNNDQTHILLESTDQALHKLCQFRIGRGPLEQVLEILEQRRDRLEPAMAELTASGVDMFDRNHQAIKGTNPIKFDVSYARAFQKACQHLIDAWAKEEDGALYCLPLDSKGYVAVHRSELSQEPTGDPAVDLARSRHMRFFQSRDIPYMGRFRLQSYLRDTGEVMFNLSVPVHIGGKYWGGLFMGLPASRLGLDA
ncbi:MAG: methyl-accepting chemotaxis protein [Pseudohongiella sp.]|uniref:methyl-accepting chemotaxis protein n=1 Tax=Pseudohongiella sp. TaxID=1979412 RepID=UPI0034A0A53D